MKFSRRRFIEIGAVGAVSLASSSRALWAGRGSASTHVARDGDDLYERFRAPGGMARPWVRWWWNGGRIVKEELIRELDVLKSIGIGGVEINAIQFPETADPLNYPELRWLSDEWIQLVGVAAREAKARGLLCDIIVGSGWPFGAEHLTAAEQTQMMALGTRNVSGPQRLSISRQSLIDEVNPPVMSKRPGHPKQLMFLRLAPAFMEEFAPGVDLSDRVQAERIEVDVPAGEHVLYFLVRLTGFESVIRGAPGASGPVLNHYSKPAVQAYLDKMSDALTARLGPLGDHFRACFVDSLELEGANWCDDMLEEFSRRRGYELTPYLPFVLFKTGRMGRALSEAYGSALAPAAQDVIERVRYDFEVTKIELFRERFLDTFTEWCRRHGVLSRVQAYGRELHPVDSSALVDLPDCETWIRADVGQTLPERESKIGRAYSPVNKFVSSGARLAGKKHITCEEVTNTELVFNASLERIKVTGDQSNLSGVTHSILHGFNYSPPEAPFPGWVRYGTYFSERNPWWPYLRRWIEYKSRLSSVFQSGTLQSNVALLHPLADLWSRYGVPWDPFPEKALPAYVHNVWEAVHQNGSGCDIVSERVLQQARSEEGRIQVGTRSYDVLILIEVESLAPATADVLRQLVQSGSRVVFVGKVPDRAPGLRDRGTGNNSQGTGNETVKTAVSQLKESSPGRVHLYPAPQPNEKLIDWYRRMQTVLAIRPFAQVDRPKTSVSQVHYRCGDRQIFFFANSHLEEEHETLVTFDTSGKTAWIWNPETGGRERAATVDAPNQLRLSFAPAESKLIVFENADLDNDAANILPFQATQKHVLSGPWQVHLEHVDGTTSTLTLETLVDFSTRQDLRSFAGVTRYEYSLSLSSESGPVYLDLGRVAGISELRLNGQVLGCRWYGHHRYALGAAGCGGANKLEIRVTTTLGNYLKTLTGNKDGEKWLKKQAFQPAGLIGPVQLLS